jgi:G3E family GTPase
MIKIDLVTGFLGSGKTTFIRHYARYLLARGERICILENDYGAINIDMVLLKDLLGKNLSLEMVIGGDGQSAHQRRFRTKLISIAMLGYTRVIVEPSGIYDVDEFFDTLSDDPLDRWYEVNTVLSIVDAHPVKDRSTESGYVLASECADAGKIILSKTRGVSESEIQETVSGLNQAMETIHCNRRFTLDQDVIRKDWEELTEAEFDAIASAGYVKASYLKHSLKETEHYDSLFYMNVQMPEQALRDAITGILGNPAAGKVYRVKGFTETTDRGFVEVNATAENLSMQPIDKGTSVLVVIGEKLVKPVIDTYFKGFTESGDTVMHGMA